MAAKDLASCFCFAVTLEVYSVADSSGGCPSHVELGNVMLPFLVTALLMRQQGLSAVYRSVCWLHWHCAAVIQLD